MTAARDFFISMFLLLPAYPAISVLKGSSLGRKDSDMTGRFWRFGATVLSVICAGIVVDGFASSLPDIRAPRLHSSAVLVKNQRTNELLLTQRADNPLPIASITKLMTAMVILDARLDMEEIITIKEEDKDTIRFSQSRLPVGTQLTRRDTLMISLMSSDNRAAHALGRTFPTGVDGLVRVMNEKARTIGLVNTRFAEPTGLSEGNVSSAHDLALLVDYACHYPKIRALSTQEEATIQIGSRQVRFLNTNALVRNSSWHIGLSKTGYILDSGRCLVMQTQLGGEPIIIILLDSAGINSRDGDVNRIRQWLERVFHAEKQFRSGIASPLNQ
jgi:serine-type D-Ala-D-Ala endopeptidase (penicillin-binding protein 7)